MSRVGPARKDLASSEADRVAGLNRHGSDDCTTLGVDRDLLQVPGAGHHCARSTDRNQGLNRGTSERARLIVTFVLVLIHVPGGSQTACVAIKLLVLAATATGETRRLSPNMYCPNCFGVAAYAMSSSGQSCMTECHKRDNTEISRSTWAAAS